MNNKIILDFMAPPRTVIAEATEYAEFFGVRATVTLMHGPTGWPIVEFVGGWAELDALLTHYHRGQDHEEDVRCRNSY